MALTTVCTGFEFGTTAGWATGNAGNKVFDTITGTPTIVTTTPRTGTYCLEVSASGAAEAVQWGTNTIGTGQNRGRVVFAFRIPTSLPAADTILARFTAAFNTELVYHQSTGKIAARFEGDALVDGPTISADTTYLVEMYTDMSANPHTFDWWIDGTAQTQVTKATAADTFIGWEFGASVTAQTFTCRYDDAVGWFDSAAIAGPKGAHKVVLLSVDPTGTVTLSGTAANFNTFTANGTLAAWNATTARNNVDEVPPTIGASADGWVQITLQTTEYVEMPMTSYTLAAGESVAAVRMLAAGWAVSATAATIGFRSFNGTTETTLFATADPNFDNSTTAPAWVCKMLTLADVDTQTELDALAFRAGFSGDATPDIGIHAIYAEVAVKEAVSGDATATPSTVAGATGVGSASAQGGAVAAPSTAAATAAVATATAQGGAGTTPSTVAGAATVGTATISVGSTIAVSTVAAAASIPTPGVSVGGDATATPSTVAATASVATATAQGGAVAAPSTVAATTAVASPSLSTGSAAAPTAAAAVASVPTPTVATGSTASPSTVAAAASIPTPSVSAGGGATATPTTVAATASVGAATASVSVLIPVSVVALAAVVATPNVSTGATAVPDTVAALASVPMITLAPTRATSTALVSAGRTSSAPVTARRSAVAAITATQATAATLTAARTSSAPVTARRTSTPTVGG